MKGKISLILIHIVLSTSCLVFAGPNKPDSLIKLESVYATQVETFVVTGTQIIATQGDCSFVSVTVSGTITGTTDDGGGVDVILFELWDDGDLKDYKNVSVQVGSSKDFSITMTFEGLYLTGAPGVGVYANELGWYEDPFYPTDVNGSCQATTILDFLPAILAGHHLVFPFQDRSVIWQICQGYNTPTISHKGSLVNSLDFAFGTGNLGRTGCYGNPTGSEDKIVVSPGAGKIAWNGSTDTDITCIELNGSVSNGHGANIKSIMLGHLKNGGNRAATGTVVAQGAIVGELCGEGDNCPSYGDYAHVHISMYTSSDCSGTSVPIGNIFDHGYNFSSDGTLHQWHGTEIPAE